MFSSSVTSGAPGSLFNVLTQGGWVMLPLALLSMITLTLLLYFLFSLRLRRVVSGRYMSTAEALMKQGDLIGLLSLSDRHREIIARIIGKTVHFLNQHPGTSRKQIYEVAQTEGAREAGTLNQQIAWLSDIATIAPMLGLLGTIFGMIRSFNVMANDVAATRPMLLAGGVAQALVATGTGLVIGIIAMAAYALFRGKVQEMISDMESATTQLLALLPEQEHTFAPPHQPYQGYERNQGNSRNQSSRLSSEPPQYGTSSRLTDFQ